MPALPPALDFTDSMQTEAGLKTALTNLRGYLSALFGDDGLPGTALIALGAPFTRVVTLTVATNLGTTDRGEFIEASGTWNLRLPSLATAGAGWSIAVRNTGTGVITLTRVSPDTIDGAVSVALQPRQTALIVAGAEWKTIVLGGTATGQMRLPSGVLATPALAIGGQNTGLFSPAASQVAVALNGVQALLLAAAGAQLDLPLTGSSVQSGAYDTTPGRVARVFAAAGMFGLGNLGALDVIANLDGLVEPGAVKAFSAATTGTRPVGVLSTDVGIVWTIRHSAGVTVQRLQLTAGASVVWERRYTAAAWTAWAAVQLPILGTVAQVSGQPTGALIEAGENANGIYRRFACGLQICWSVGLAFANANTARGSMFISSAVTWTFPAAFFAGIAVAGEVDDLDAWLTAAAPGTTSVSLRAMSAVTKATALNARAVAIGRWF